MTNKLAIKTNSNSSNRSQSGGGGGGRSRSPKHRSGSKDSVATSTSTSHINKSSSSSSNKGTNKHHYRRPDAVVFPPDPKETGQEVVQRVLAAFGLSDEFPTDCQQQVATLLAEERNPWKTAASATADDSYVDHTHIPYITIDNEGTRDLDQAMFLTRQNLPGRNGANRIDNTQSTAQCPNGFLLSYALADGAHYVPAESPLFQFALRRGGTSFYLPGKMIPMLPHALSEGLMSLMPNVKRRALIFDIYLNAEGYPLKTFFQWGYIKSRWKGTYQEVTDYYTAVDTNKTKHHPLHNQEYTETLTLLRELGIKRRQIAQQRHVVALQKEQRVGVVLNKETGMLVLDKYDDTKCVAELYNEQISLLCNSEGAKLLHFMDALEDKTNHTDIIHPIYRSQGEPAPQQVALLRDVIETTLKAHEIDPDTCKWNSSQETISDYLERLKKRRDSYEDQSPEHRVWSAVLQVVQRQAMATNVAATLGATSSGHYGLKVEYYARFSAPMRELVGCFTHKELWEAHEGKFSCKGLTSQTDIELRDQVIRAARRARLLQKKLNGAIFLHMMNLTFYKDLKRSLTKRPVRRGVLLGLNFAEERNKSRRCYVQLEDDPPIEIKVFAQDLEYFYNCRYVVLPRKQQQAASASSNNKNPHQEEGESAATTSSSSTSSSSAGCAVAIGPLAGSFKEDVDDQERPPVFKVGQRVTIRVADYAQFYGQTSRSRWCFIMDLDVTEEQVNVMRLNQSVSQRSLQQLRNSALRNSILDIDLFSQRDSTSVASGTSEGEEFEFDEL